MPGCAEQYSSRPRSTVSLVESFTCIEDTVMKSGPPDSRTVCRYCGLDSAVSHGSTRECIEALQREGNRLRAQLLRGRLGGTAVSQPQPQPTSDGFNASAMPPRMYSTR